MFVDRTMTTKVVAANPELEERRNAERRRLRGGATEPSHGCWTRRGVRLVGDAGAVVATRASLRLALNTDVVFTDRVMWAVVRAQRPFAGYGEGTVTAWAQQSWKHHLSQPQSRSVRTAASSVRDHRLPAYGKVNAVARSTLL